MKTNIKTSGRISVQHRRALVAPVKKSAQAHKVETNLVMSAVLWAGERLPGYMSLNPLKELISVGTIASYRADLNRRAAAHHGQLAGMIRRALPKDLRDGGHISIIINRVKLGLSIPSAHEAIRKAVDDLTQPISFSAAPVRSRKSAPASKGTKAG